MKSLAGHTLREAKEIAKRELGVKRMGEARFQMLLDEGVKKGDFIIEGAHIISKPPFFDLLGDLIEEPEPIVEPPPAAKIPHPESAHLDPKLSSSDLPRKGDLYYYRAYTGEIVQGEILSALCFTECQNPNGTWQTVAFQDLCLNKKGVPKETKINLEAHYFDCNQLKAENKKLLAEHERLTAEIKKMKSDLKNNLQDS